MTEVVKVKRNWREEKIFKGTRKEKETERMRKNGETSVTSFFFQKASDGLQAPEFSPPPPGVLGPRSAVAGSGGAGRAPSHSLVKLYFTRHTQPEMSLQ